MRYRANRLEAEDLDLGFGSVVADESRRRLLNRDGSFNVVRRGLGWRGTLSLYHSLLTLSWPRFLLLVLAGYLATHVVFAILYTLCGTEALTGLPAATLGEQLQRSFFFSVHTLSTIGYGQIVPATLGANLLMTAESIAGLFGLALVTGLVFARFSRPTADVVFSDNAVVAPYRGLTAFQFRIANRRRNQLVDLTARVHFTRLEGKKGERKRRFYDLELERRKVTFFPLSWTLVHPIDDDSPLAGLGPEDLAASE
ncbi:MAG: ion channel, partial [Thermoanaerobaculia bacterium]